MRPPATNCWISSRTSSRTAAPIAFPSIILANTPGLEIRNSRDKRTDVENSLLVAIIPVSLNSAHYQRVRANAHLLEYEHRLFINIFCVQSCRPLIGSMCFDFFAKTFSSKGRLASRVTTMAATSASSKLASFWCKGHPPLSQR